MKARSTTQEMDSLLELAPWVQELASRLVRDPDQAEDLAQDVMVAALESPAVAIRSRRSWLARVLRNLLHERLRREGRRSAREEQVARSSETDSTGELVARMSAHQEVVATLMELPEHYRITLLRRYFSGQKPQRIAAETEVPISTVKTRLARGLELMRERLDRSAGGDGKQWLAALAPLVEARPPAPLPLMTNAASAVPNPMPAAATATVGAGGGLGLLLSVAVALALALGGAWIWTALSGGTSHEIAALGPAGQSMDGPADRAELERGPDTKPTRLEQALAPTGGPKSVTERPRADRGSKVQGRVVSVRGEPLAGVVLELRPGAGSRPRAGAGASIALSEPDGSFELAGLSGDGLVRALGEAWVTLFAGRALGNAAPVVVVAPPGRVEGRVVDAEGAAVSGLRVWIRTPVALRSAIGPELASAGAVLFAATTQGDGAFAIDPAPAAAGLELCVETSAAEVPAVAMLAGEALEVHELVVGGAPRRTLVRGRVLTADGLAAEGAHVVLADRSTSTDGGGSFELALEDDFERASIAAWSKTGGAAFAELRPADRNRDLLLELSGAPRTIRGVVRDRHGRPVSNAAVWLADPSYVAGPPVEQPEGSSWLVEGHADLIRSRPGPFVLECALAGRERESWAHTTTARDGRFELRGLLEREYSLAALAPYQFLTGRADAVGAGAADVEIVLAPMPGVGRKRGVVVGPGGDPVAGVKVSVIVPGFRLLAGESDDPQIPAEGEQRALYGIAHHVFASASDEAGRFWVEDLPVGAGLAFSSAAILPLALRPEEVEGHELEVSVTPALRVRVELADPNEADEFRVLARDGQTLRLHRVRGLDRTLHESLTIEAGRSDPVRVAAGADRVELWRAGTIVRNVPLKTSFGEQIVR